MRAVWFLGVLVASAFAGCAVKPVDSTPQLPVLVIDSQFTRHEPNGTEWSPPFPGYHGCGDSFEVEERAERVRLDEEAWKGQDLAAPRAFVSILSRDVGAHHRNHEAFLPETLPYEHQFLMGNVQPYNVTLRIEEDEASFNRANLPMEKTQEYRFDYEWRRDDGVVLDVIERITIQYLGQWKAPLEFRESRLCL